MMEKMKMHSPNLTQDNITRIKELFPGCVTEAYDENGTLKLAVDFDQLRQELSESIVEGPQERYHLNWPGKREALLTANAPIAKTLRPCRGESVDFDTTKNLFIEGDNLEALKLLQETYLGKVKMIYIDPPYNTGNDFIYEDDFAENSEEFLKRSNQKDEEGNRLVANTEANGRFHSDWLSMIYARLKLARNLLSDNGSIILSIDDAEYENLKKCMDEIYGLDNYLATLVWDKNRKNDAKYFSVGHEYMLIYSKSSQRLLEDGVIFREPKEGIDEIRAFYTELKMKYGDDNEAVQLEWRKYFNSLSSDDPKKLLGRFSKIDSKGPFRDDGNISWPGGGGPKYDVVHPETGKKCKVPDGGWRYGTPKRFWEEVASGKVVFGPDESTLPRQCRYLFESEGQVMRSVHYSYAQTATMKFNEIMGQRIFENPKSYSDIQRMIRYLTNGNDLVVDFFAGSATTAHSVVAQNSEDGGNRKFIMVQLPELCDQKSEAFKSGYKTIAEISKEHIRRVGKKILEGGCHEGWNKDIGFRVLKIDSSNMAEVYYTPDAINQGQVDAFVDNIKPDRKPEDLLFQVLLDWGVDLSLPIRKETIQGKSVFYVNHPPYDLIACFDDGVNEELVKELARSEALRVVFRDNGFVSDSVKINVEQIFKQLSPGTEVKSI